ncbi:hypothetical protein NQ318_020936 [Aromia moschata]|uniref:Disease resistance R13L4/SHOC-2-like LRR domain-containing protein n=1 Tax=Aromia moschata TaxID=1265417 RepID=A0AAV8Y345_9CUCU|nr:hypothetical protein NQ318_020936 [Aromia moschata]
MQDNNLTDLPQEIGSLTKLTKLYINHNKINNLPKEFYKLTELKYLFLHNNCLNSLSKDVADLVMLEKLEVPLEFCENMIHLKILELRDNQISIIPNELTNLAHLIKLDLTNNSITELTCIPKCIYGMVGVEILLLNDNSINEIDIEELQNLKRLATLNLSNNNIHHVPPQLGNITQLRYLYCC